jgi:hypothetical protein
MGNLKRFVGIGKLTVLPQQILEELIPGLQHALHKSIER